MRKRTLQVAASACVVLLSALVLGGCGKETTTDTTPVTLVYWGLWEPESVMEDIISEYEASHTNVKIEYARRPFSGGVYKEQLLERLADADPQKAPDIMRIHNSWLPQFSSELAPLPSDVMNSAEYAQTFYDTAANDFTANGNIYAIPLEIDTLGLVYNKDLFENEGLTIPPADWDSFIEYAKKLTKTDESGQITQAGAAIGASSNVLHSEEIISLLMLQSNIPMTDDERTKATFDAGNNNQGAAVLEYYTDFITRYKVWSESLPNSLEMFASGKVGMMIVPSWRIFDLIDKNPQFEFDTAKVPQISLKNEINYSTYWGEAVSKDSANTAAAWEFVKYISEKEQQKKLYSKESTIRAFGEPYSRKELKDDLKSAPLVGPYILMAPTAQSWYMGNDEVAYAALNSMITQVLSGEDAQTSIESAASKVTAELEKLGTN